MTPWEGIGITAGQPYGSWFEFNDDTHEEIAAPFLPKITKFPRVRAIRDRSYDTSKVATRLWMLDIKNHNPDTYCLYGVANNQSVYLPTFYDTYLPIMIDDAQWAQENGMDAFCPGNEFEGNTQRGSLSISSISRSSNVSTVTTSANHNLLTGDTVDISGANESAFNVTGSAITVIDDTHFTYSNAGSDGSATGTLLLKPGEATIVRIVKAMQTVAMTYFTRGPVIYSVTQGHETYWTSVLAGTLIGLNVYADQNSFAAARSRVATMFGVHGTNMIVTEFNVHYNWSLAKVRNITPAMIGFDEVFADMMMSMVEYFEELGLEQAYIYSAWNASSTENNNFVLFYNTNTTTGNGGALQGNWKELYSRLLFGRQSDVFLGTQEHT